MEVYIVAENMVLEARGTRQLAKVNMHDTVAKLGVTEQRGPDCQVKIHMWPKQGRNKKVKVAFSFMGRYVLKVNGATGKLELEEKQIQWNTVQSSNQFQFYRTRVGRYCELTPVGDRDKFLSIVDGKLRLCSSDQEVDVRQWRISMERSVKPRSAPNN